MEQLCSKCSFPTKRSDGHCQNCVFSTPGYQHGQTETEYLIINALKYSCVDCGLANARSLILLEKPEGLPNHPGFTPNNRKGDRDERASRALGNPTKFFTRCYNCQARFHKSAGRPRIYSDEERQMKKIAHTTSYRGNLIAKLVASYGGKCVICDGQATRILYIGEPGKGPNKKTHWSMRRWALTDPEMRLKFAPYCDFHEARNFAQRVREVKFKQHQAFVEDLRIETEAMAAL